MFSDPKNINSRWLESCCKRVYKLRFVLLRIQSCHLEFLTSSYLLTTVHHYYNASGMSVHENVGAAIVILLLASVTNAEWRSQAFSLLLILRASVTNAEWCSQAFSLLLILSRLLANWGVLI